MPSLALAIEELWSEMEGILAWVGDIWEHVESKKVTSKFNLSYQTPELYLT